jgi:DedD protein
LSTPFQNRLVGTIIVAAVIIIFVPDILDGEKTSHQADFEAIPTAEVFSGKLTNKPFPEDKLIRKKAVTISNELAVDDADLASSIEQTETTSTSNNKVITKPVATPPEKLEHKINQKLPEKAVAKEAWVIHLGSFRDKDNVAQLLKKLKSNGYITFTRPIETKQGTLTKVIIGPELIKSSLINKIPALKELTGIQGKISYFEPTK